MEELHSLLTRSGIVTRKELNKWSRVGAVQLNHSVQALDVRVKAGDSIKLQYDEFLVKQVDDRDRLRVDPVSEVPDLIRGKHRVHCGYHKCLTMYYRKVFNRLCNSPLFRGEFRHFYHRFDVFLRECNNYNISSVSGFYLNPDQFEDIRISRFIRDPRDLLISGYFYHKRSAEDWCDIKNPSEQDWKIVNGTIPQNLPSGQSLAEFLNTASMEEGLIAEMDFRRKHYNSMLEWPDVHPQIKTFRYEDLMGNEVNVFDKIFKFYELPYYLRKIGLFYAERYSAKKRLGQYNHIRDASSGQWRKHFTPALLDRFNSEYGEVLEKYGYPLD